MATSKLYKHILLATDLSDHSLYIAKRAATIAKTTRAKLTVVHVLGHSPIAYAGEFSIPVDAEFEMQMEKQARKQLEKLCLKIHVPKKSQLIADGSIKIAITALAKKINVNMSNTHTINRAFLQRRDDFCSESIASINLFSSVV